ncbi:MAG: VOC family protein [Candidatus Binataceae bacterium]
MGIELNHLIVPAGDKWRSARFVVDILGLASASEWGPFVQVRTSNGVTLDFAENPHLPHQHYAFLVTETEFDAALVRVRAAGIEFYADFNFTGRGEINHLYGGRGFYFHDLDGHALELITRPYGAMPEMWTPTQPPNRE